MGVLSDFVFVLVLVPPGSLLSFLSLSFPRYELTRPPRSIKSFSLTIDARRSRSNSCSRDVSRVGRFKNRFDSTLGRPAFARRFTRETSRYRIIETPRRVCSPTGGTFGNRVAPPTAFTFAFRCSLSPSSLLPAGARFLSKTDTQRDFT